MQRVAFLPNFVPDLERDSYATPFDTAQPTTLPTAHSGRATSMPGYPARPSGMTQVRPSAFAVAPIQLDPRAVQNHTFAINMQKWIDESPSNEVESRLQVADTIVNAFNQASRDLYLFDRKITSLPECLHKLESLEILNVSNNPITRLPSLPKSLKSLNASSCALMKLPQLPATLVSLDVRDNQIAQLPPLPAALVSLQVQWNALKQLPQLPTRLRELGASDNDLTTLPPLPSDLKFLEICSNRLTVLPVLPKGLRHFDVLKREIVPMPQPPASVSTVFIDPPVPQAEAGEKKNGADVLKKAFLATQLAPN